MFTRKDDNPDIIDDCENHLGQINSTEQTIVADEDRISSKTLAHNDYQSYDDLIKFCKALLKNPFFVYGHRAKGRIMLPKMSCPFRKSSRFWRKHLKINTFQPNDVSDSHG